MLRRLFPMRIDNVFPGPRPAIWILIPIVLSKLLMGINSVVNTQLVATGADGIPINSYGPAGAGAVVSFFSLWGFCTVLFALQGVLVLIRYRAAIPFMYLLLLTEQLGRKALLLVHPIDKASTSSPGLMINLVLFGTLGAGLIVSLMPARKGPTS